MRNGRWRGLGVCALSAWAIGACEGGTRPVGSSAATGDGGVELAVATEALLPGCSSVDAPDDSGIDSDGDGIDGTARCAVIVDPSGSDWDGCGTTTDPCRTLGYAIEEAVTGGYPQVLVGGELYSTLPITIRGQVGVHAGYRRSGATYTRASGATARVEGSGAGPTIRVEAGTLPVTLDRLVIVAPAGSAEAAYPAVHLLGSTQVTLRGCELRAPDLGATWWAVRPRARSGYSYPGATAGGAGAVPVGGARGGGYAGYRDLGGQGGNGASGGATAGARGQGGEGGAAGGVGGVPGSCSFTSSPGAGGRGADGSAGGDGANGTQYGTLGVFRSGRYLHFGSAGSNGVPGAGGGGGGGGGAAFSPLTGCVAGTGGGGGGGGGGGAHGTGGQPGAAGEPSVALVIEGSSGRISGATLYRTRLVAARAGVGQAGGHGGRGGEGAAGGLGASSSTGGRGGDGGRGGRGGGGGGGAGGSGGVSACAWMQAGTLWHDAASTCSAASTRAPGADAGCRVDASGAPTASCAARGYAGTVAQVVSCEPGPCATSAF